jgi:hypothetical protein
MGAVSCTAEQAEDSVSIAVSFCTWNYWGELKYEVRWEVFISIFGRDNLVF